MKLSSAFALIVVVACMTFTEAHGSVPAQNVSSSTSLLADKAFELTDEAEVGLEVIARSRGASWAKRGAEAAALTITVDGVYSSDLILWAGDEPFTYRAHLGRLSPGKHTVALRLNKLLSASGVTGAGQIEIANLRAFPAAHSRAPNATSADIVHSLALSHSPVLYARANTIGRFTDAPLLMYYEATREGERDVRVRYTVVFSHEDGGTPTAALMARWGRATDIEWVYEFLARDGALVEERYQGVEHEIKMFIGGRTLGAHPLLAVASDNNNFTDLACSAVRYALLPVHTQFDGASREKVMDEVPWTYRIMAEELARERRLSAAPSDEHTIADPREYLYIEAHAEQTGTALSLDTASSNQIYSSDNGDARLRVDRSGYFRVAVRLPSRNLFGSLNHLVVRCHATTKPADARFAKNVRLTKVFTLDENYVPRELRFAEQPSATLKPGEKITYRFSE